MRCAGLWVSRGVCEVPCGVCEGLGAEAAGEAGRCEVRAAEGLCGVREGLWAVRCVGRRGCGCVGYHVFPVEGNKIPKSLKVGYVISAFWPHRNCGVDELR